MSDAWITGGYFDPMDELEARRDRMSRDGYTPCSMPACNCGSWHRRDDEIERLRAALGEIADLAGTEEDMARIAREALDGKC